MKSWLNKEVKEGKIHKEFEEFKEKVDPDFKAEKEESKP
jgi:hypothetical protein